VTLEKNYFCKDLPLSFLPFGNALFRLVSWNSNQNKGRLRHLLLHERRLQESKGHSSDVLLPWRIRGGLLGREEELLSGQLSMILSEF
jgi:hypothetical protein